MTVQAVARDYESLSWSDLKKFAKGRGVAGRRPKAAIIADLKIQDERTIPEIEAQIGELVTMPGIQVELKPDQPQKMNAYVPPAAARSEVRVVGHTRDAVRIVDGSGNTICLVYRVGLKTGKGNGERYELPMADNAEAICKALNKGR